MVPFVQQIFMPFVSAIFNALSVPVDENDQPAQNEKQLLQRSYFLFIAAIVTNNIPEVIASQGKFIVRIFIVFCHYLLHRRNTDTDFEFYIY